MMLEPISELLVPVLDVSHEGVTTRAHQIGKQPARTRLASLEYQVDLLLSLLQFVEDERVTHCYHSMHGRLLLRREGNRFRNFAILSIGPRRSLNGTELSVWACMFELERRKQPWSDESTHSLWIFKIEVMMLRIKGLRDFCRIGYTSGIPGTAPEHGQLQCNDKYLRDAHMGFNAKITC